ncbi:hypothetical protein [Ensifer canadensis]|uniref:hypothetical protein n=1 Tax=Ensifer canadensis TaxID=555315 RepID=UPI001F484E27|nr:hypothetical protein [Ensifer canadensis]
MENDELVRHLSEGAIAYGKRVAPSIDEWRQRMVDIYAGRIKFATRNLVPEAMVRPAPAPVLLSGVFMLHGRSLDVGCFATGDGCLIAKIASSSR